MGCLSTCFGKSKRNRRNRKRPVKASPSLLDQLQKYESTDDFKVPQLIEEEEEEEKIENPIDPSPESDDEKREKGNVSESERKKVTFDLNVKIYEQLPTEQFEEEEEEEEALVNGDSVEINAAEKKAESNKEETVSDSNSSSSSLFSYPLNHRYQNCADNDDEIDEIFSSDDSEIEYYTDEDDEDDEDEQDIAESRTFQEKTVMCAEDHSSESLFSVSLESRKQNSGDNKEVNSPIPTKNPTSNDSKFDRSNYANHVLNPVENVAQWKIAKAKSKRMATESKENLEKKDVEIGVDTSLSSWLKLGSETTPNSKTSSVSVGNSPRKYEDRPILGALTLEEIRKFSPKSSSSSSPRKSPPGFSPDDKPIIGSVGSYWSHTEQSTNSGSSIKTRSKFGENAKVIWDPTPFETRLEKALEDAASLPEDK